ncbi:glycosyltransferase [Pusillimonas sp. MFBS29]|nr:glycosyltransferase [Pusillimonas sp. MFBS29]MCC2595789.1 glycosyltransferase [Pusillimonas sp. MFBS29]
MPIEGRVSIVVTAYNSRVTVLGTLNALCKLPGAWPILVIDNGSTDGTAAAIAERFPSVMLIRARRNLGGAARNIAAAYVHTPYIAFCDADTRWEPGALERAASILDAMPEIAVLSACVRIGAARQLSPACGRMAKSSLPRGNLPGPRLLDFSASACIVRTRAFLDAGGFWPPFFTGGEEALLSLDIAGQGMHVVYMEDVICQRLPRAVQDSRPRKRWRIRNEIWLAWMRRPVGPAWRCTCARLEQARVSGMFWRVLVDAAAGLPKALRQRRVISPAIEHMRASIDERPGVSPGAFAPAVRPWQNGDQG